MGGRARVLRGDHRGRAGHRPRADRAAAGGGARPAAGPRPPVGRFSPRLGPAQAARRGAEVLRQLAGRAEEPRGDPDLSAMDARTRVRQFLASGTADRPPFLAMATEYTARLAQCPAAELLADPGLFVRSFQQSVTVLGLEAVLIEVPAARVRPVATGGDPASGGLDVLREDLHRLRATLGDQVAIVAPLPGPVTLAGALGAAATPDAMDDLVAALIAVQEYLGP